jgi:hypothetical protein
MIDYLNWYHWASAIMLDQLEESDAATRVMGSTLRAVMASRRTRMRDSGGKTTQEFAAAVKKKLSTSITLEADWQRKILSRMGWGRELPVLHRPVHTAGTHIRPKYGFARIVEGCH